MRKISLTPKNKVGGVVSSTVMGVGGLIIGVVMILVVTSTILNANLLTDSNSNNTAQSMQGNFTKGIANISGKIPTILLIVAVVFLFGALILLIRNSNLMGISGGGSL